VRIGGPNPSDYWIYKLDIYVGLINTFGVHLLKYLNNISIWWHAIGTFAVVISVLAAAPELQPGSFVFTQFLDNTGDPGWSVRAGKGYVVMIGILMSQYTLTGFDASAHVRELRHNPFL
jgi:amino acid transporter